MQFRSVAGIIRHSSSLHFYEVNQIPLFIAKRIAGGSMGNRWEFPGGKVEHNETPQEALIREFEEEFAVTVRIGEKVTETHFFHGENPVYLEAFEVFLPSLFDISDCVFTEHTEAKWEILSSIKQLSFVDSDINLIPGIEQWLQK